MDTNTIATAGHCAFEKIFGRLVAVEVFAGYETESREIRRGTHAVVHWGWYKSFLPKHDLAFIRLDNPFEHTSEIPYIDTPANGTEKAISVYGYPADLGDGKRMHYSECEISYDLAQSEWMLEYDLDTSGGSHLNPRSISIC